MLGRCPEEQSEGAQKFEGRWSEGDGGVQVGSGEAVEEGGCEGEGVDCGLWEVRDDEVEEFFGEGCEGRHWRSSVLKVRL